METNTLDKEQLRKEFAILKHEIGNLLTDKFLEYNEGKFHTGIELNPVIHSITEFMISKLEEKDTQLESLADRCEGLENQIAELKTILNEELAKNRQLFKQIAELKDY